MWIGAIVIAVAVAVLVRILAPAKPAPEPDTFFPASTVPVFAGGALERLPLSLSLETFGGVSTMLIFRDTALPAVRRETFSTAADNQSSIEVHVLVGDRTLAANNVTVGKFRIVEIPAAPRGVPMFQLEIHVDRDGMLRLSATNKRTGRPQPITTAAVLPSPLSAATVARMLDEAKAEEARGEYGMPRTTPDALDSVTVLTQQLRHLVQTTRQTLQGATGIPAAAREACDKQLAAAEQLLENQARPERASAKLNTLKADELEAAIASLSEAARRCQ